MFELLRHLNETELREFTERVAHVKAVFRERLNNEGNELKSLALAARPSRNSLCFRIEWYSTNDPSVPLEKRRVGRGFVKCMEVVPSRDSSGRPVTLQRPISHFELEREALEYFGNGDYSFTKLIDWHKDDKFVYLVLRDYGRDSSLETHINRSQVEIEDARDFIHFVGLNGLVPFLEKGYTMRDFNVGSVLRTQDGRFVISDLGILNKEGFNSGDKAFDHDANDFASILYRAPESLAGKVNNQQSDIYSFATVFYHLITRGGFPFESAIARGARLKKNADLNDILTMATLRHNEGGTYKTFIDYCDLKDAPRFPAGFMDKMYDLDEILATALAVKPAERVESLRPFCTSLLEVLNKITPVDFALFQMLIDKTLYGIEINWELLASLKRKSEQKVKKSAEPLSQPVASNGDKSPLATILTRIRRHLTNI